MARKIGTAICWSEYGLLRILFVWFIGAYVYRFYVGGWAVVLEDSARFFFGLLESLRLWFSGSFWLSLSLLIRGYENQKQKAEMTLIFTIFTSAILLIQGMFFPLDTLIADPQKLDSGDLSSSVLVQIYGAKNSIGLLLREVVVEMTLGLSLVFYFGLRSRPVAGFIRE